MTRPSPFLTKVAALSGVGAIREVALREKGIESVLDLLLLAPTRYRTIPEPSRRSHLVKGASVSITGIVQSARRARQRRGGTFLDLVVDLEGPLRICFYNRGWLKDKVSKGDRVLVTARVPGAPSAVPRGGEEVVEEQKTLSGMDLWVVTSDEHLASLFRLVIPAHPVVPNVAEGTLRRLVRQALDLVASEPDPLPEPLRNKHGLAGLHDALVRLHEPSIGDDLGHAGERLLFDRLLGQSLAARSAAAAAAGPAPSLASPPAVRARILDRIPFPLTPGQAAALEEILGDLAKPVAMRRLLLGDVGSGKTAVAAGALLAAVAAGCQALLVAPTDALAAQHHATLSAWLAGSRVELALLSGRVPGPAASKVRKRIAEGLAGIVVGTHAVLASSVKFPKLGLVIFDEQHRFGVMQRLSGRKKAERPHVLALSATPIPRSLCLALFGELAITRLNGRPAGTRTPATRVATPEAAYDALRGAVARGERAFVVFPSIAGAASPGVEREGRALCGKKGPLHGLAVGFLHGGLPVARQIEELLAFRKGIVSVLVSTVIVEVGLDVPEATVIVIEGAERFGLATLHQLRGRVGRGERAGTAFLVPSVPERGEPNLERLRILEREMDGFRIAEADLELRGPGDWCGVRQHGFGGPLPVGPHGESRMIEGVDDAARTLLASGYDPSAGAYYPALGRTLQKAFDPKDAV